MSHVLDRGPFGLAGRPRKTHAHKRQPVFATVNGETIATFEGGERGRAPVATFDATPTATAGPTGRK